MKINWKLFISCVALPLLVGTISALLTQNSMDVFSTLNKPPLSPPGWLFPIVWTLLYMLMGVASYLVLTSEVTNTQKKRALSVYILQLIFNFFWSILFFNYDLYLISFIWLVVLWILILSTIILFDPISKTASYLLIPYLIWVSFAGYLNLAIYFLN